MVGGLGERVATGRDSRHQCRGFHGSECLAPPGDCYLHYQSDLWWSLVRGDPSDGSTDTRKWFPSRPQLKQLMEVMQGSHYWLARQRAFGWRPIVYSRGRGSTCSCCRHPYQVVAQGVGGTERSKSENGRDVCRLRARMGWSAFSCSGWPPGERPPGVPSF